jgi:hypothetical protein
MANSINFFRFSDHYEDVFKECGHYLYACAEPNGWAYMVGVNEYAITDSDELIRYDGASADVEYLRNLEPAIPEIAARIIKNETRRYVQYCINQNGYDIETEEDAEDARAAYIEYKTAEIENTAKKLRRA